MSGVFVVVWDKKKRHQSDVLKSTRGGYPHFTLVYSGDSVETPILIDIAKDVMSEWATRDIVLTSAYINSFEDSSGNMRHDVLMHILESDAVEDARDTHVRSRIKNNDDLSMNSPHVTHAIYDNLADAKKVAATLNASHLPMTVTVIGVAIN